MKKILLGVDTGGTFTDFTLLQDGKLSTHKVLSTPAAPEQAIVQGVRDLGLFALAADEVLSIVHGSTVATNAVLEGKGVNTVYITNRGLRDTLTLGRQARRELYNLQPQVHTPPLPPAHCLETGGRLSAQAEVIEDLSTDDLTTLQQQVAALKPQAVAINLLFSFLDNRFEQRIASVLPGDLFISCASAVLPEIREYERGMTTWLNAYVGPLVKGYLTRLQQAIPHASIHVMQSAATTVHASQAGDAAVRMLLSGPAGGLAAALYIKQHMANKAGEGLLTFDMGGTSTDVALVQNRLQLTNSAKIADYPVAVPMVDMHTIGAGGGSIASVDAGGLLQVGPQSAGAAPGPACYGKGGSQATVTDANLVLGRLLPDAFLGGAMTLDVAAAHAAVERIATQLGVEQSQAAQGIVDLANDHMAQALRVMSVQRGIDPRQLVLTCFGGAGGLHVCALAESLQMTRAVIPMHAGVLSALGMLIAEKGRHLSHTVNQLLEPGNVTAVNEVASSLQQQGEAALREEQVAQDSIHSQVSVDCRYQGQSSTLNVLWQSAVDEVARSFHQAHAQRFGHELALPIEVVNVRVAVTAQADVVNLPTLSARSVAEPYRWAQLAGSENAVPVYDRMALAYQQIIEGPALVTETVATSYIAAGWQAEVDAQGNLLLVSTV